MFIKSISKVILTYIMSYFYLPASFSKNLMGIFVHFLVRINSWETKDSLDFLEKSLFAEGRGWLQFSGLGNF